MILRSASDVYALLADLTRHWPLLGGDLIEAGIVEGERSGAADLVLRGPLPGIRRRVRTRVTYANADTGFGGEAIAGDTRAAIDWQLAARGASITDVSFAVAIEPGGLRDRLLIAGARGWLARRCELVLERLENELSPGAAE